MIATLQALALGAGIFDGQAVHCQALLTTQGVMLHAARRDGSACECTELTWQTLDMADGQLADREWRRLLARLRTERLG